MEIQENIVNKVASSGLITLNLEEYYHQGERVVYDLKENLFHGLILREKDFREFIKTHDWTAYSGKNVAIICSADAIVPTWAYMLLANRLKPFAHEVVFGGPEVLEAVLFTRALSKIDISVYKDERVVIKGCADIDVPVSAYVEITALLTPVVKSIMYGEPCSTVPIYKRKD
jgi:TATA-box binding protein (TBP) (component of TFIID and TFIIIB)